LLRCGLLAVHRPDGNGAVMTVLHTTASGSQYEVDELGKQARQLLGTRPGKPSNHFAGEAWVKFDRFSSSTAPPERHG
jgi:hypothetical protein